MRLPLFVLSAIATASILLFAVSCNGAVQGIETSPRPGVTNAPGQSAAPTGLIATNTGTNSATKQRTREGTRHGGH